MANFENNYLARIECFMNQSGCKNTVLDVVNIVECCHIHIKGAPSDTLEGQELSKIKGYSM